jgi:tetratricopeptide (TPR) repeat protein
MPEGSFTPAQLALEQAGLEFLRSGKFRKARDSFKSLHKILPAHALPLLIEANLGLANEMMAKGLASEANQVMAYLKTIAPADQDLTLTPVTKANPADAWAALVGPAGQRLVSATPQSGVSLQAADEIILGASSPEHPEHPDARAILAAFDLGYGPAASEETAKFMRTVPRASPFSHWVLFFKGMAALEAGDLTRAADCFRKVPEASLLQASIPALLTLCRAAPSPRPTARTVQALCRWMGDSSIAEPLLLAEPLWRTERCSKVFTLLVKKVPGLLCWGARSFKSELTRLLASEFADPQTDDFTFPETVLNYVTVSSRSVALATIDRAYFAIDFENISACAHSHFATSLDNLRKITPAAGLSPAMLSRIFTRLAETYLAAIKRNPGDSCNPPNAKKALEQALKHDPSNLRAWLMQCDLLAMGKDTAAYYRFLDDLTKRFPEHKEVLIRNGDCCVERRVYTKALRNFEGAAKIDAVDPRISRGTLRARLGIAEEAYKKRTPAKANWSLIDSLASANTACPEHALWRLRVRRMAMEAAHGSSTEDFAALVTAALPLAPSAFLLKVACRFQMVAAGYFINEATVSAAFRPLPVPAALADFLAIIDEVEALQHSDHYERARRVAYQLFETHRPLLLRFVVTHKDFVTLLIKVFSSVRPDLILAEAVIQERHRQDPTDLVVRLMTLTYNFSWLKPASRPNPEGFAREVRDAPDPEITRLLLLIKKETSASEAGKYSGKWQQGPPKLDLDYDPHDDDDDDEFDPLSPQINPADLLNYLEGTPGGKGGSKLENIAAILAKFQPPSKSPRP